jgi:cobalt-zinc-cadmium efflux system membrane fusion protein
VNAEIELNNAQVQVLPSASIVKWQNKSYVFVETASATFIMVPIVTGMESKGMVEIISGISAAQKIVVANAYTLLMKLKNSSE